MLSHDQEEISLLNKVFGRKPLPPIEWSDTVWETHEEKLPVGETTELSEVEFRKHFKVTNNG